MIFSAKSKTFLVGEYCVTCGGSAIVLCTPPSFLLKVGDKGPEMLKGIRASSPAFAFYERYRDVFKGLFIKFYDPHIRAGGFGASSAQFSMLYKLKQKIEGKVKPHEYFSKEYTENFLKEYHSITQHLKARNCGYRQNQSDPLIKPSGTDCIAQLHNCNIYFNSSSNNVEKLKYWPFDNIDFVIIRTGQKLPTYRHLCQISHEFIKENSQMLSGIVENVREAWKKKDSQSLVENVAEFGVALKDLGLVTPRTHQMLAEIKKLKGVLAAKGCGAMGADTILIIFDKDSTRRVLKGLEKIEKEFDKIELLSI